VNRVKIADLKNNLSRYLSHVRDGGGLIVLDRDTPIARIIPFDRTAPAGAAGASNTDAYWTETRLADLERRGTIARGDTRALTAWIKDHQPAKLPAGTPSAVELLLRQRRESTR